MPPRYTLHRGGVLSHVGREIRAESLRRGATVSTDHALTWIRREAAAAPSMNRTDIRIYAIAPMLQHILASIQYAIWRSEGRRKSQHPAKEVAAPHFDAAGLRRTVCSAQLGNNLALLSGGRWPARKRATSDPTAEKRGNARGAIVSRRREQRHAVRE